MELDESASCINFLIRDRDVRYPPELEHLLSDAGIATVRSAVRAPREIGDLGAFRTRKHGRVGGVVRGYH